MARVVRCVAELWTKLMAIMRNAESLEVGSFDAKAEKDTVRLMQQHELKDKPEISLNQCASLYRSQGRKQYHGLRCQD